MSNPYLSILERENRTKAFWWTVVVITIVALLLFFIKAFDLHELPMQPSGGIEINFGLSKTGSGDLDTRNIPNPLKERIESAPPAEVKPKPVRPEPVRPTPPKVVPRAKPPKVKPLPTPPIKTTTKESPVKVKDQPPAPKPEPRPSTTPTTPAPGPSKPAAQPAPAPAQPKIDDNGLFKPKPGPSGGNGTSGSNPRPGGANSGDDAPGTPGTKGHPDGDKGEFKPIPPGIGGKNPNGGIGGNGPNMSLSGFRFAARPQFNDPYDETGRIVFKIKVDEQGNIIGLTTEQTTVSQRVVSWYRQRIMAAQIVPTNDGERPSVSVGTISITLRSE
jgi:periplasmic protein TonB